MLNLRGHLAQFMLTLVDEFASCVADRQVECGSDDTFFNRCVLMHTAISHCYKLLNSNSTRLFCSRPIGLALSAIGCESP